MGLIMRLGGVYETRGDSDITIDMPAGATLTRFEFDAGTDWIVMDNLRLKMTTLAPPSLNVVAGSSAYYGDASDNTFTLKDVSVLSSASIAVHGNSGIDTLKLTGAGQTLDVSTLTAAGKLSGVEVLDITGTGNNTLKLSLGDVLELGGKDLFRTNSDVQM
ncbi:hypothetical protein IB274_15360 [Pseudomonas sp. PDM18]|uniref:hypothetical protein n=1 Tax=Pseudomonas sp. PDM18 TaxID=2769253 RepID=UPI0017836860|nr:hypothetical protein [Pseudomonas sp. PDM18]MBD9678091.1 hypothetical protein [Pseudomonas sp. PDM18]